MTTTVSAIRDRIIALIASRTPTSLADDKFRAFRNELGADFRDWAEKHPDAAFRRFQVREVGDDEGPDVSNGDIERVRVTFEIVIAYPQTHRYGADSAMDRDDCINADWLLVNAAVGIYGRANFSGAHDCTPLGAVKTRETGEGVDFMVVEAQFEYVRSVS